MTHFPFVGTVFARISHTSPTNAATFVSRGCGGYTRHHIPQPRTPEDEMASEPWYSIGPLDVFPEEFPPFLFADAGQRRLFNELHGEIYDAEYWKSLQAAILEGKVIDVFPYRRKGLDVA